VGNLHNPDVRYSFNIPIEEHREQFVWDPSGSWLECNRICQGKTSAGLPDSHTHEEWDCFSLALVDLKKSFIKARQISGGCCAVLNEIFHVI